MSEFTPLGFVSGTIAGGIGIFVGYPLDTMKVRAQVGVKTDCQKLTSLFKGCAAPIATGGGIQCLNFGVFENSVRWQAGSSENATLPQVCASGAAGGLSIAPFTCPQQRMKIQQQLTGGSLSERASAIYRAKGIRGFYRAFHLHSIMESTRGVYMMTYVGVKRLLHSGDEKSTPLYKRMLAGAAAGTTGWTLIYPMDAVKSVIQAERAGNTKFPSISHCVVHLFREGGIRRFYRGFGYTLLRSGPVAASLLPTYDLTLRVLTPYFHPISEQEYESAGVYAT